MQYVGHGPSFVFAEVENFLSAWLPVGVKQWLSVRPRHILPDDSTGESDESVHFRLLIQHVHIIGQGLWFFFNGVGIIFVKLSLKHAIGGLGVLIGTVCTEVVLHLMAGIESVRRRQVARFMLMEDGVRINKTATWEVKVDTRTKEFLGEHGYIEAVRVKTSEVATRKRVGQTFGKLLEGWRILHHFLGNSRQLLHEKGDRPVRIDKDAFS